MEGRMKYMKRILSWLLLAMSVLWVGTSVAAVNLPPFILPQALDGQVVSSDAYKGQALLITFFAPWCAPCLQEIPMFNAVQDQYKNQGFSVVALAVDEGGPGTIAKLMREAGIKYQVLLSDDATRKEFGGVDMIPTAFLVNKQGHVVKKYDGMIPEDLLVKDIASVL